MNKFRKKVLILIGVIFIMVFICYVSKFNSEKYQGKDVGEIPYEEGVFPSKEEREKANIGVVYLENMKEIVNVCTTNKPVTKIAVKIEYVINNIFNPAIKSINNLETFFQEHKEEISEKIYINDYTDFERIIMKITDNKDSEIVKASILKNSADNRNGNIYAKIEFKLANKKKSVLNLEINEVTFQIHIRD